MLIPLKKNVLKRKEREKIAGKIYEKHLMKHCFEAMNEGVTLIKIEKNIEISKNLEKAKLHHEISLKKLKFFFLKLFLVFRNFG